MVIHLIKNIFTVRYTRIKFDWLYELYSRYSTKENVRSFANNYDATHSILVVYRQYVVTMTKQYANTKVYLYR